MRFTSIIQSTTEPNKDALWIKDGHLYFHNNGEWCPIKGDEGTLADLESMIRTIIYNDSESIDSIKEIEEFLKGIDNGESLAALITSLDKVRETKDTEIMDLIFKLHATVTCTASPSIIEKGVNTTVNFSSSVVFDGTSKNHTLKINGSPVSNPYTISDTTSFNAVVEIDDPTISINKTVKVSAYYPKYIGGSSSTTLTATEITSLTKMPITASAAGTYKVTSGEGQYIWFCVPSTMTISKVTLGGFTVPIETAINVVVNGKGTYKCYRTTNPLGADTRSFIVS